MLLDHGEPTLDFRVLGPLQILKADREVPLPGQYVRRLLAVLLLAAGTPVVEERLVHHVWEAAPHDVRTLRTTVSRLRWWLREEAGLAQAVKHTGTGYVLQVAPGQVDAERFLRRCRLAARGPDSDGGLESIVGALGEWRGAVLEGAPGRLREHPAVQRLERARVACASKAADLALELGRPEAVLPYVRDVAAAAPYDEPLQARFIRLLGGSGRRAEGLRHFEKVRRTIADELGVDPSSELRAAHTLLLGDPPPAHEREPAGHERAGHDAASHERASHEAAGHEAAGHEARTPDRAATAARRVAAELPMDVATFTGRTREVGRLCEALTAPGRGGTVIASISGASGVGKSALAIHVAHRIAERYPDGQLYINLLGSTPNAAPLAPAAALGRLLRSLGMDDQSVSVEAEEGAGQLRSLTAGKRLLIVLDNALDAAQVRGLFPGGGSSAVLLTSRKVLMELDGATHLRLDLPSEPDCVSLFSRLIGHERARADMAAVEAVVRLCGHLPLAVCIAAARLNARPTWIVRTLADRLATDRDRLAELRAGDRTIQASFAVGFKELDAEQARLFRLLSLLANPDVGVGVAAALGGMTERRTEDLLDDLVDLHMVENHAPGRYRLHDLLRQFAFDRAQEEETPRDRADALRRVLHWYLATARTACVRANPDAAWRTEIGPRDVRRQGMPLDDWQQTQAWVAEEATTLPLVLRNAIEELDGDGASLAVGLAAAAYLPLGYQRRWKEQLALTELALEAAARTGDPLHHALAHGDLGDVQSQLGQPDEAIAHLTESLEAYRGLGHLRGESSQLDRLAGAYGVLGRFDESIRYYQQALALDRRQGDRFNQGITLSNLGLTYQKAGHFDEAIRAHGEAIAILRETDSSFGLGSLLGNLAEAQRLRGQPEQALVLYEEALRADGDAERSGTYDEAEHWWGLSRCYDDLGRPERARECRRTSGAILHDLGLIGAEERRRIDTQEAPPTPEIIRRNT
ncbi:tetratricopeptide repeat protein [Nonomuraea phyllanthi]|uniref:AfsR/SARP family transcriptional regulator n=1 Tax=Nonomuraea phyllanthi TaxID=2219224 RepID=UPI001293ABD9|nr:tetratricopeptide repeat protein [Nonomuraea phyllanthi]QFY07787.1 tetratricopeptide repeat protein [Nonomuraea phyllanthi]